MAQCLLDAQLLVQRRRLHGVGGVCVEKDTGASLSGQGADRLVQRLRRQVDAVVCLFSLQGAGCQETKSRQEHRLAQRVDKERHGIPIEM
ncbi:hypothetical protein D3C79_980950 [compost metagenome]